MVWFVRMLLKLLPPRRDTLEAMRLAMFMHQMESRSRVAQLQRQLLYSQNHAKSLEVGHLIMQEAINELPSDMQELVQKAMFRANDRYQARERELEKAKADAEFKKAKEAVKAKMHSSMKAFEVQHDEWMSQSGVTLENRLEGRFVSSIYKGVDGLSADQMVYVGLWTGDPK